jgi:hypothetical protein
MKCPNCATVLKMTFRQQIEIDYCPKCRGVWLDKGELDKLIERAHENHISQHEPEPKYRPSSRSAYKRKRGYKNHYDDDDYSDKRRHKSYKKRRYDKRYRKKSWKKRGKDIVEEIFDIFD